MAQGGQKVVRFPDGSTKPYPPDWDEIRIAQDVAAEMPKRGGTPEILSQINVRPGSQPPAPIEKGPGDFETPGFRETVGNIGALGAGLIPGAGLPAIGARMGGTMAAGLFGGGVEGMKKQGLMQGVGEAVAAAAPPLGLLLGSITGGGGVGKKAFDTIGAFMRERNRAAGPVRGLHNQPTAVPVAGSRIPARKAQAGANIEKFESSRPERVKIEDIEVKGQTAAKASDIRHQAKDPEAFHGGAAQASSDLVFKQAADAQGLSQATLMSLLNSRNPAARELGELLIQASTRSVREAGDLHRNISINANKLLKSMRGAPGERAAFNPEVERSAFTDLNLAGDVKRAKEAALPPEALAEIKDLEKRFSDLAKMQDYSRNLWGGGGFFTPHGVGAAGVRGGVASGLARAAIGGTTGFGLGLDPATAALLFASATPANLARAGNLIGDAGELGPTIMRGTELVKGKKTERKKPGGR